MQHAIMQVQRKLKTTRGHCNCSLLQLGSWQTTHNARRRAVHFHVGMAAQGASCMQKHCKIQRELWMLVICHLHEKPNCELPLTQPHSAHAPCMVCPCTARMEGGNRNSSTHVIITSSIYIKYNGQRGNMTVHTRTFAHA
jgi:hypothetical protein